jgi:thioredoxin-like negative regulator of GroEL
MGIEAWETLEDLPSEAKNHQRILELCLEILCRKKEWRKAVALGRGLTAAQPQSSQAHYWLAVAECQSGDIENATKALRMAIDLDASLRLKALDQQLLDRVWGDD